MIDQIPISLPSLSRNTNDISREYTTEKSVSAPLPNRCSNITYSPKEDPKLRAVVASLM